MWGLRDSWTTDSTSPCGIVLGRWDVHHPESSTGLWCPEILLGFCCEAWLTESLPIGLKSVSGGQAVLKSPSSHQVFGLPGDLISILRLSGAPQELLQSHKCMCSLGGSWAKTHSLHGKLHGFQRFCARNLRQRPDIAFLLQQTEKTSLWRETRLMSPFT